MKSVDTSYIISRTDVIKVSSSTASEGDFNAALRSCKVLQYLAVAVVFRSRRSCLLAMLARAMVFTVLRSTEFRGDFEYRPGIKFKNPSLCGPSGRM